MSKGELFNQLVSKTNFSEDLSRHVILQVGEGCRYLHEELGVVHRDIKLENLLFEAPCPLKWDSALSSLSLDLQSSQSYPSPENGFLEGIGGMGVGVVKIADFGLSKVIWEESTMTPCGTDKSKM